MNINKIINAIKRSNQFPVSLIPIDCNTVHPVFNSHCNILQPKTSILLPGKTIHAINRLPNILSFFNYSYIAEVEMATAIAPVELTKYSFDLVECQKYINNEIKLKKLKKIIFQSKSALDLNRKWMTAEMLKISDFVTLVPPEINKKELFSQTNKINVLIIISKSVVKGSFLIPRLLKQLSEKNINNIHFNIVTAELLDIDSKYSDFISQYKINRLSYKQKSNFFQKNHLLLNMSPMDTLGTFLDSIWFNTPLITVTGQHAPTYVKNNETGFIVDAPIFYYSDDLGKKYFNVKKDFKKYLLSQDIEIWDKMMNEIVGILGIITIPQINSLMENLYRESELNFTIQIWLDKWNDIYQNL